MVPARRIVPDQDNKERDLSQLLEAACLLMGEELALGWLVASLSSFGSDFVSQNSWPASARNALLIGLAVSWAGTLACLIAMYVRGALSAALRLGRILLPILPFSLLPALWIPEYWRSQPLHFLLVLALFGWLTEITISRAAAEFDNRRSRWIERMRPVLSHPALPLIAVSLGSAAYIATTGLWTIWKHHGFGTGAYDLAIFDNMMWNAMHGDFYQSSIMYNEGPGNSLAGHAEIAMVLFVPFYALAPSSEALLWIQATCLGAAAIPLYLLSREFVENWYAALIAILYLFYAPLHGAQFYDYHWLTIIPPFLFLAFYGLVRRLSALTIAMTVLLWLLREDVAPGLVIVGAVLAVSGYRVKAGLWLAGTSLIWFVFVKFILMPSFGTWFFADLYAELTTPTEKGYGSVIKTLLTNPVFVLGKLLTTAKFEYFLHILAPVALIPLRRVGLTVLLLPGAFFTIFTNWSSMISITYQYSVHFTAYVFAGVAIYLGLARSAAQRFGAAVALTLALLTHSAQFGAFIRPNSFVSGSIGEVIKSRGEAAERLRGLRKLAQQIPPEASVIATTRDTPHLSARSRIYSFGHSQVRADYVVIHPHSFGMGTTNRDIWEVIGGGDYGLVAEAGQTTLWKKGYDSETTPAAINALRRGLRIGKGRGRQRS